MLTSVDDRLAISCGQVRPLSLIVSLHNGQKVSKYIINKPYAIIGRHAYCDISLANKDVSNQHVYLQVLDGRLFCVDQHSRKWVFWKDKPRLYGWLDAGEWIQFGPYRVTLEQPVGDADCRANKAANTLPFLSRYKCSSPSDAQLVLSNDQVLPLQSQMTTIGRSNYCNLELEDDNISRVHASIVRTHDGQYWIIDLKSAKGVKVNGHRCQSSFLSDKDIISIGEYTMAFQVIPRKELRKSKREHILVDHACPTVVASMVTEPEEVTITSAKVSFPDHADLLRESTNVSSALVLREQQRHAESSASSGIGTSGQLVAKASASLVKPKSNIFVAPHIKLSRPLVHVQEPIKRAMPIDDSGPMDSLMQFMKQMQQDMMTQMRMNMEMMAGFMHNMQKQQSELIREEMAHISKLNKELLELRQQLLTSAPVTPAQETHQSSEPPRQATHTRPVTETAPRQKKQASPTPAQTASKPTVDSTVHHSHVWISKRIASLEKERLSRWEKMKAAMMGK